MSYAALSEYIPQHSPDRRPVVVWAIVTTAALILLALIVGTPIALARGHTSLALTIYASFSHLCHQLADRSFFITGQKFAVCARCTGIYVGFAGAMLCYPLIRSLRRTDTPQRKWLFIAVGPLAIDFSLTFFGLWENTRGSRFLTGALLGSVAVFYIMPGLIDLSMRDWHNLPRRKPIAAP